MGRTAMFQSQIGGVLGDKRMNLAGDDVRRHSELQAVAANTDSVFSLKNYDVLTLMCHSSECEDGADDDEVDL